jgi:hypothetical protein
MLLGGVMVWGLLFSQAPAQYSTPEGDVWMTNGAVRAIAQTQDMVYLGGNFSYVSSLTTYNGVPLDLSIGKRLASYPKVEGTVHACVPDGAGGWYIGGEFTRVGGLSRNKIAHILPDYTVNTSWAPDANDTVYSLAVSGTTVYAGGRFTSIGGQERKGIAALNASGNAIAGWNPNASAPVSAVVYALAVKDSTVYAGGSFTSIGGLERNNIAALDAATGNATAWNPNADGLVRCFLLSGNTVYVGGYFSSIGGEPRNNIAALDSVTGNATDWNPNANTGVSAITQMGETFFVGGGFTAIGGENRTYLAALDSSGAVIPGWNPELSGNVNTLATFGNRVFVGGFFKKSGERSYSNLAAFDATTGNASGWCPNPDSTVYALAAHGTTLYVGGAFRNVDKKPRRSLAAIDKATGEIADWGPTGYVYGINIVYSLLIYNNILYIGGNFSEINNTRRYNIAAVDATTGLLLDWSPNASTTVSKIAVSGNTIYVAGTFRYIAGETRNGLAAFDATTGQVTNWNPVSDDRFATLRDLHVIDNTVYVAGGRPLLSDPTTSSTLAAYDAITGNALDWNPAINYAGNTLSNWGNTLYVGGSFTMINGKARNSLAAVDIPTARVADWNPRGTYKQDNHTYSIQILDLSASSDGSTIYTCGFFTHFSDTACNQFAALDARTGNPIPFWDPSLVSIYLLYSVYTIDVSETDIFVGGGRTAQGLDLASLARFRFPPPPAAPSNPSATDIATDAITWTWQDNSADETGFKVFCDIGSSTPTTYRVTTPANTTSWTQAGLIPNTQYTARIAATLWNSNSPCTPDLSAWTLAAIPVPPLMENPTEFTLDVTLGAGDGNPPDTLYAIYCPTVSQWVQPDGSLGALPAWQTVAAWGTITVTGLAPEKTYLFQAKTKNGANIESVFGTPAQATTDELILHPVYLTLTIHGQVATAFGTDDPSTVQAQPWVHEAQVKLDALTAQINQQRATAGLAPIERVGIEGDWARGTWPGARPVIMSIVLDQLSPLHPTESKRRQIATLATDYRKLGTIQTRVQSRLAARQFHQRLEQAIAGLPPVDSGKHAIFVDFMAYSRGGAVTSEILRLLRRGGPDLGISIAYLDGIDPTPGGAPTLAGNQLDDPYIGRHGNERIANFFAEDAYNATYDNTGYFGSDLMEWMDRLGVSLTTDELIELGYPRGRSRPELFLQSNPSPYPGINRKIPNSTHSTVESDFTALSDVQVGSTPASDFSFSATSFLGEVIQNPLLEIAPPPPFCPTPPVLPQGHALPVPQFVGDADFVVSANVVKNVKDLLGNFYFDSLISTNPIGIKDFLERTEKDTFPYQGPWQRSGSGITIEEKSGLQRARIYDFQTLSQPLEPGSLDEDTLLVWAVVQFLDTAGTVTIRLAGDRLSANHSLDAQAVGVQVQAPIFFRASRSAGTPSQQIVPDELRITGHNVLIYEVYVRPDIQTAEVTDYIVGRPAEYPFAMDFNGDGVIDAADAIARIRQAQE